MGGKGGDSCFRKSGHRARHGMIVSAENSKRKYANKNIENKEGYLTI